MEIGKWTRTNTKASFLPLLHHNPSAQVRVNISENLRSHVFKIELIELILMGKYIGNLKISDLKFNYYKPSEKYSTPSICSQVF
jgi:hypothetical protein